MVHMHLCALAEELEYPALLAHAQKEFIDTITVPNLRPRLAAELVIATFFPLDSSARICKDEEGWVQRLVVTAVLVQEAKHWADDRKGIFRELLQGKEWAALWTMHGVAERECVDLLLLARPRREGTGHDTAMNADRMRLRTRRKRGSGVHHGGMVQKMEVDDDPDYTGPTTRSNKRGRMDG
jgi:hypothetical protein